MANDVFSPFQVNYSPLPGCIRDEEICTSKDPRFEMDETGFLDLFSPVFDQEAKKGDESFVNVPQINASDDWMQYKDVVLPISEFSKHLKDKPITSFSMASWDLFNNYDKRLRTPREVEEEEDLNDLSNVGEQKLSTGEILMVAAERFIQFSTNKVDGISMFIHPYGYGSSLSGLFMDDARDVELVHLLLASAEYVGTQQFDLATKLISRCLLMASRDCGTPVQRVAFYFAEALQEKINRDSGRRIMTSNYSVKEKQGKKGLALGTNNTFLTSHQQLPFFQVTQFAGIQAIIENVKTAKKIHLIDLQIRSGIQWTALIQGLADCPIQRLKITAVGTCDQKYIEETGKRLLRFARSLHLPFSFKVVYLTDMTAFKEDVLNIEADETVAVYSNVILRSMISKPDMLENLMREITRLKPALMVVTEVEANHNSPSFVDRFIEALLFYSAYFDCLEDCMEKNNEYRSILEGSYFGEGIMDIVGGDGEERITRNVKVDVWRAFFRRFGMIEMELSESARYQASLVLKQFAQGSSCTVECNGKGLTVGWKGTPLHSLTAWNFSLYA
ncbi:hypothetical protein DH2020_046129 [Rehmannia glutinosa]|uniref:DELLA protein n=1 Tax=Rehmannia glutinosa TaxID=99300 RepID=A0ABR0UC72_REHGL